MNDANHDAMTYRHIAVKPVAAALGAEIEGVDLTQPADAATMAELRQAWLRHQVLFFRGQVLSAEQLKGFLGQFGELHETRWSRKAGGAVPDRYSHQLDSFGDDYDEGSFTCFPHIDNGASVIPVKATALCALEAPSVGGDTMWVSLTAAFDALSPSMKAFVGGLTGIFSTARRGQLDELVLAGPEAWKNFRMHQPVVEHPLVHTHPETGRKALFVDSVWTWSIKDLEPEESDALLGFLRQHCARSEFQCRLKWQVGTTAFWDNRCTQHYRVDSRFQGRRLLQRASIIGTEPPMR
jgi:taurine dioxygenase